MTAAMSPALMTAASVLAIATGDAPLARFVSAGELVDVLTALRTASVVTITSRTEPRLAARHPISGIPNPFKGNIVKVSRTNGIVNWSYANSVNNQRVREDLTPDFQALPRRWGTRLPSMRRRLRHCLSDPIQLSSSAPAISDSLKRCHCL